MAPSKIKVCEPGFWLGSGGRPAGRDGGRPAGRLSAAPVSPAAPKKKAFDRGGPVWPPRSNAADDRLGGDPSLDVGLPPPSMALCDPTPFFEENLR